jgi:hypothetical protein
VFQGQRDNRGDLKDEIERERRRRRSRSRERRPRSGDRDRERSVTVFSHTLAFFSIAFKKLSGTLYSILLM